MLHDADDYLVASFEHRGRKALGNKVERLTRIACEHDVVCEGLACTVDGTDQGGYLCAHPRDCLSCLDRERIEAAQRVGVHRLVEMAGCVKHAGGALRGGGAVQERDLGMVCQKRKILLIRVGVDIDGHTRRSPLQSC